MDVVTVLRNVDVFSDFDDGSLQILARSSSVEQLVSGQVVIERGSRVDSVWIVASGEVRAVLESGETFVIESPGLFGEMSLLTGEPASAEVSATSPSVLVRLPHSAISAQFSSHPAAALKLARLLASRLTARSSVRSAKKESLGELSEVLPAPVLVLNLGSSSIKYALFVNKVKAVTGLVERIGLEESSIRHDGPAGRTHRKLSIANHEAGLRQVFELLTDADYGALERIEDLAAVGHRTVHGGTKFTAATVVDDSVIEEIERVSVLAPLHNPVNLAGIRLCRSLLPSEVPQVVVFDTAFHMTMPEHAYRYALPRQFADERMLRRFGFHGTSHAYVSNAAAVAMSRPVTSLRLVTCHLGNGASVAAVNHGRCVDTSMGLTPLEGLVMGTRSGDVDPGLVLHLQRGGMSYEDIDKLLNKSSGLLGLSGLSSDMRELEQAAEGGHPGALLAIASFCYRVRKYIGAYAAAMGGIDAVVFTGGIGENADGIRSRICNGLSFLGIEIDEERNRGRLAAGERYRTVSRDSSRVKVLAVATDEEGMIALETTRALQRSGAALSLKARKDTPIPVGVSAHHVHLTDADVERLFGFGHSLTPRNDLSQPGQFACEECVDLVGPKGRVDKVRILGPTRPQTQVEISRTEEFKLGIDAPIRASGDLAGSPGLCLVGPKGSVQLEEGVICALRHIHMSPLDALSFGLRDKDVVRVKLSGERSVVYGDVLVRVHPDFVLEMHIDTDEANAAEVLPGTRATIDSIQKRA